MLLTPSSHLVRRLFLAASHHLSPCPLPLAATRSVLSLTVHRTLRGQSSLLFEIGPLSEVSHRAYGSRKVCELATSSRSLVAVSPSDGCHYGGRCEIICYPCRSYSRV